MLFAAFHEFVHDVLRGNRTIHEDEIFVVDAVFSERIFVVLRVIQSHHLAHLQMLKYINVARSGVAIGPLAFLAVDGSHESHELSGDNPIEIAILNLLVVLILFNAERLRVVPPLFDTKLKTLQTVLHRALVVAVALACVAVVPQQAVVGLQLFPSLLGSHLE